MSSNQPDNEQQVLTEDSRFRFACHDTLPCFTQCCRDVNIYLTPYDILRLRRALKISSTEVLERYTRHFLARVTHIPVVQLEMDPETLNCRFVSDSGCRVYDNRPWACRMYPLDVASRSGEYMPIAGKERCLGLNEPAFHTVGAWLESQGVRPYEEMERAFLQVVPPDFQPSSQMNPGLGRVLFLAYDIDRFIEIVNDPRFQTFYDVDDETLRRVREDDEALLHLAFRYVRSQMEELYKVV